MPLTVTAMGSESETVIRASALPQYLDCARRTAVRLWGREIFAAGFDVKPSKPSIGAVIGTVTHSLLQEGMMRRVRGEVETTRGEMMALAAAELAERLKGGAVWDDTTTNPDVALKQTVRQAQITMEKVAPSVRPVGIEREYSASLGDGFVLRGHLDVLEADGIVDWKTGTMMRANQAQYGAYSLLARSNGEAGVRRLREVYVKRAGLRVAQPDPVVVEYDQGDAEDLARATALKMKDDLRRFRDTRDPYVFMPNPNSMMCGADYCPAWGTEFCKAHKHGAKKQEGSDAI